MPDLIYDFFSTFKVTITLERLECVKEFDQDGHSEPYLWPAFLLTDASTAITPGQAVDIAVPFEMETGRGLFGDAGKNVKAGDTIEIPASLGQRVMTLDTFRLGRDEIMLAGLVVVLLEQDSTPAHAIRTGHQEFGTALREEINTFVADNLAFPDAEQIQEIKDTVSGRVKKAIKDELSWYHIFDKQDDLVGFIGGQESLFTADRIRELAGKGPQAQRTAIEGTETFSSGIGLPAFTFKHHYDLIWRVEVEGVKPGIAPTHAVLLRNLEDAGKAIQNLDLESQRLSSELNAPQLLQREALISKLEQSRQARPRAVQEFAIAWEEFIGARRDEYAREASLYETRRDVHAREAAPLLG